MHSGIVCIYIYICYVYYIYTHLSPYRNALDKSSPRHYMASHAFRMIPAVRQTRLSSYTPRGEACITMYYDVFQNDDSWRTVRTARTHIAKRWSSPKAGAWWTMHVPASELTHWLQPISTMWLGLGRDVAIGENLPGILKGLKNDVKLQQPSV